MAMIKCARPHGILEIYSHSDSAPAAFEVGGGKRETRLSLFSKETLATKGFDFSVIGKRLKVNEAVVKVLTESHAEKVKATGAAKKGEAFSLQREGFAIGSEVGFGSIGTGFSVFELQEGLRKDLSSLLAPKTEETLRFDLASLSPETALQITEWITTIFLLKGWECEKFGKRAEVRAAARKSHWKIHFHFGKEPKGFLELIKRLDLITQSMDRVRTLADLPGNILTARNYVERVRKLGKELGVEVRVYGMKELLKEKAGAFLAVAQAAPDLGHAIVKLSYRPKGTSKKSLALVGKGLCFDTGGYNVKTGNYMNGMQRDMTGSAVALATFEYLVKSKVGFAVDAWLAIAENHISPLGFKADDVVVAVDGTSIEVENTDAEGRMVLADTLAMARREKPDLTLDFATLTGSVIRAIGKRRSGAFTNRNELRLLSEKVGAETGERVHIFPVGEDFVRELKSDVADIRQISKGPGCDHIYAATFLLHFIGDESPWVHLDLSAAECEGGLGVVGSSTTGFGVRFAAQLVSEYFP